MKVWQAKTTDRLAFALLAVDVLFHLVWYWFDLLSSARVSSDPGGSLRVIYSSVTSVALLNLIYPIAMATLYPLPSARLVVRSATYLGTTIVLMAMAMVVLFIAIGSAFPT
jgi:hypothetical protein